VNVFSLSPVMEFAAQKQGGSIFGLLILVVPMGAILWLTIVPQRRQRQRQAELMTKLEVGEEVITNGGIIGTITFVDADRIHLEVDTDIVIQVTKGSIARTTSEPPPAARGARRTRGSDATDDSSAADDSSSE